MKNSFVYEQPDVTAGNPAPAKGSAVGYRRVKGKDAWRPSWGLPPFRRETMLIVGDGNVWSCLDDLERWDAAVRAGKLLKPATRRAALIGSRTRDGKTNDYGLGWSLYRKKDGALYGYGHDGDWSGFRTSYYRHLTTGRSYIVLSNRGNFPMDTFGEALIAAADAPGPESGAGGRKTGKTGTFCIIDANDSDAPDLAALSAFRDRTAPHAARQQSDLIVCTGDDVARQDPYYTGKKENHG